MPGLARLRELPMSLVYELTVPVFNKMLGALLPILDKAAAFAAEKKFDEVVLFNARLAPDMFAFSRQVQIAADFAKGAAARLTGVEVPRYDDTEASFADLKARIEKTLAFVNSVDRTGFEDSASRSIQLSVAGKPLTLNGLDYLREYAFPNFYFHLSMAYAILRNQGVALGKNDFLAR